MHSRDGGEAGQNPQVPSHFWKKSNDLHFRDFARLVGNSAWQNSGSASPHGGGDGGAQPHSQPSPTSLQTPQGPLSQPWLPSLHGWYVGRLVGALVGALVVGALVVGAGVVGIHDGVLVGELVGELVGAMVGASVGIMVGAMVGSLVGVLVVGA